VAADLAKLRVHVTESNKDRDALPGASVVVLPDRGGEPVATGSTDVAGDWKALLQPGRYHVTVSLTGFEPQTRPVELPAKESGSEGRDVAAFQLKVAKPVDVITIDDRCAFDPLQDMGTWRICARDLESFPWH
jgi:hypothetical protein